MPSPPNVFITYNTTHYGIILNISNPEPVVQNNVYRMAPNEDWELIGVSEGQSNNYTDFEAASAVAYDYKVEAVASDETTAESNTIQGSIVILDWLMKDIDDIESSIALFIDNDPLDIDTEEHQAKFNPLGSKYPLVIKDAEVKSASIPLSMQFTTEDDFKSFESLREKQKILLLQSPIPGRQWYFVFDSTGRERIHNTVTPYRHFDIGIIEVGRP